MPYWEQLNGEAPCCVPELPNPSRSYDETRHGVYFWGYDQTFEISFFVEKDALSKVNADTKADETGSLTTFDTHRERIFVVADAVYSRRRRDSHVFAYDLTASDF